MRQESLPRRLRPLLVPVLALALGAALAAMAFPASFLAPSPALLPRGDMALHVLAERYFIADAWRWPLLQVPMLPVPDGSNLAFLDGIPVVAVLLKLLRGVLPPHAQGITAIYALTFTLQPLAAVWALRGTGERRALPLLTAAVLAACAPALWNRFGHAALTAHAVLLAALGLYLRLRHDGRALRWWLAAAGLSGLALAIHPYLMAMTLATLSAVPAGAVLAAVPAGAVLRWRGVGRAVAGLGLCCAVVLGMLLVLDYLGAQGSSRYGVYAMNLLSPVWPAASLLAPDLPPIDATGMGGWEGYNYLGAGVLLGLLAALAQPRPAMAMLRRHAGLALCLLALTALAASFQVGLGRRIVLDLGTPPAILEQFRGSGRLFWPVGYALALGAVALAARRRGRAAPALLLAMATLQLLDIQPLRQRVALAAAQEFRPPTPQAAAVAPLLPGVTLLTLLPSWNCGPPTGRDVDANQSMLLELIGVAALTRTPVTTIYPARWHGPLRCLDAATAAAPLAPGELRVILPYGQALLAAQVPGAARHCRAQAGLLLCSAAETAGSLEPEAGPGATVSFAQGSGLFALAGGWAGPEPWGVWSDGAEATLRLRLPPGQAGVQRWRVMGYGPAAGQTQRVTVRLDGTIVAVWTLPDRAVVERPLPVPPRSAAGLATFTFTIAAPTRPRDQGHGDQSQGDQGQGGDDARALGLALIEMTGP